MKDVLVHFNNVFTTFVSEGVKPLIFGWKKFVKESYIFYVELQLQLVFSVNNLPFAKQLMFFKVGTVVISLHSIRTS